MAVAHTGTVTGNNTTGATTVASASMAAAANEVLIAIIAITNSSSQTVSSISYGGLTWTKIDAISNGTTDRVEAWRAYATAAVASAAVTATLSASAAASIVVSRYTGTQADVTLNSADAIGAKNTATGSSSTPTLNVTTVGGTSLVIAGLSALLNTSATAGGSQTINGQDSGTTNPRAVQSRQNSSSLVAAAVTSNWTLLASVSWAAIAIELKVKISVLFLDPGGDATGGFELWTSTSGTISVSTDVTITGPNVLKSLYGGLGYATLSNIMADAGRRVSLKFQHTANPTGGIAVIAGITGSNTQINIGVSTSGVLQITSDGITFVNGSTLPTNTTVRISFAYRIISTTNWICKVYLNGVLDITASNTNYNLSAIGDVTLYVGPGFVLNGAAPAGGGIPYFDDIYVDDGADLNDPGTTAGLSVTAKRTASANTSGFDTLIGSATNRWDYINERPLSESKGISHNATSDAQENFTLETIGVGDANLTGATLLARTAWAWAKRTSLPSIQKNATSQSGKTSGTTLQLSLGPVAIGDVAVVTFGDLVAGSAPTIADNLGNTWTQVSGGPKTNGLRCTAWYCTVASGHTGTMTVTITFGSSAAARGGVAYLFDGTYAGIKDKDITWVNDATSPYDCPSSGVLAQANEVVLGFCFLNAAESGLAASGGLPTNITNTTGGSAAANVTVVQTFKVVNATTAIAPAFTVGTNRTGVTGTLSFKLSADLVGLGAPKLMDNGTETAVILTAVPAMYSSISSSTSYPSNAAGIGMRSANAIPDTFFYEGGMLIAYIPIANTTITPGVLSLTTTKFAPKLKSSITVPVKTLTTTGLAPQLKSSVVIPVKSLSLTTFAPTIATTDRKIVTPGVAALSLTSFAPTVTARNNKTVTPSVAALSLAKFAPVISVTANKTITPGVIALSISSFVPVTAFTANKTITPPVIAVVLTTFAPVVTATARRTVTPAVFALSLAAFAPSVVITEHKTVTPGLATLILSEFAPQLKSAVIPATRSLTFNQFSPVLNSEISIPRSDSSLTEFAPHLIVGISQEIPATSLSISLFAPIVSATEHRRIAPPAQSLSINAFVPIVSATANQTFIPGAGSFSLFFFAPTVSVTDNKVFVPPVQSLILTRFAPSIRINLFPSPAIVSLVLTEFEPNVQATANNTIVPGVIALNLAGFAPSANVTANIRVVPSVLNLATSRFAPILSTGGNALLTPNTITLQISTFASIARIGSTVSPLAESLTLTTFVPTIASFGAIIPGSVYLLISRFSPVVTLTANQVFVPGIRVLSLTRFAPKLKLKIIVGRKSLVITRLKPVLKVAISVPKKSVAITRYAPSAISPVQVIPSVKTFSIVEFAPVLHVSDLKRAVPGPAALAVTAFAPDVSITQHVRAEPATAQLATTTYSAQVSITQHVSVSPDFCSLVITAYPPGLEPISAFPDTNSLVLEFFPPVLRITGLPADFSGDVAITRIVSAVARLNLNPPGNVEVVSAVRKSARVEE